MKLLQTRLFMQAVIFSWRILFSNQKTKPSMTQMITCYVQNLRDVAEHCVQKLKKNSAVEEGDGSASRSTQPSILPRLIKWVSGISENLVVKVNCVLKVALALRERNLIWILTSKNLFFSKDLRILKKSAATFV